MKYCGLAWSGGFNQTWLRLIVTSAATIVPGWVTSGFVMAKTLLHLHVFLTNHINHPKPN